MTLATHAELQVSTVPCPDFDGNGTVGISDFLQFVNHFGTSRGDEDYDAKYDLDGNDVIGVSDFLIFVNEFGNEVDCSGSGGPSPILAEDFDLHADNESPARIAYANDRFYIADSSDGKVYAYRPDGPDLLVSSPLVNQNKLNPGALFTLSTVVHNRGNQQSDATTLRYYRSADPIISVNDTEIGTGAVSSLSPSSTNEKSISLKAPIDDGCYFCGACVDAVEDERNTTNNCSEPVAISVGGDLPDLALSRVTLHAPATVTISFTGVGGTPIKMTIEVTNNVPHVSAPAKLKFSGGYTFEREIPALAPNETKTYDRITVGGAELGTTTYRVCIDEVPCEENTENNCGSRSVTYF